MTSTRTTWLSRAKRMGTETMRSHRAAVVTGTAAFALRAGYDLFVHPPLSDTHSDMGGYIRRADALVRGDWSPNPGATFFPYGTHALLFVVKWIFRGAASIPVSLVFAAMGALAVVFTVETAARMWPERRWLPWVVGAIVTIEPAWIELASYALSETPTTLAISASAYLSLRVADEGKTRHALWLGIVVAIGATFRPQVLLSLPFVAMAAVARRRELARWGLRTFAAVALPVALVLGLSALRVHYDTGQWGTISTNGPFNMVFGRCHCAALSAAQSPGNRYQPPSLRALYYYKERHGVSPLLTLDPALGPELSFDGKVWEAAPAYALARRCVETTGPVRQLRYVATHWMLLWGYNLPWPTDNLAEVIGTVGGAIIQLPGFVVALALAFRRRRARELVLLAQPLGLLLTAAVFFGEARLRVPYDGLLFLLAIGVYADAVDWYGRRQQRETPRDDTARSTEVERASPTTKAEVGGGSAQVD